MRERETAERNPEDLRPLFSPSPSLSPPSKIRKIRTPTFSKSKSRGRHDKVDLGIPFIGVRHFMTRHFVKILP